MPGHVTGFFVRIKRDNEWQSLDVATLTDDELEEFFSRITEVNILKNWVLVLVSWIRDNVEVIPPESDESDESDESESKDYDDKGSYDYD